VTGDQIDRPIRGKEFYQTRFGAIPNQQVMILQQLGKLVDSLQQAHNRSTGQHCIKS